MSRPTTFTTLVALLACLTGLASFRPVTAQGKSTKSSGAADLEPLWNDLAGQDALKAHAAIEQLTAAADRAVAFLRQRLKPVPVTGAERLDRLIADMDSSKFRVRQKAEDALRELGEQAMPALRKTLAGTPPLEVRLRIERLLGKMHDYPWTADRVRFLRGLQVLERTGTPAARQLLRTLAGGAPQALLTREAAAALRRLEARRDRPSGRG